MKVPHKRYNYDSPSEGVSLNVATLRKLGFNISAYLFDGDRFIVTYKNGKSALATVSRNGRTLYITKLNFKGVGRLPSVSRKTVNHEVVSIEAI